MKTLILILILFVTGNSFALDCPREVQKILRIFGTENSKGFKTVATNGEKIIQWTDLARGLQMSASNSGNLQSWVVVANGSASNEPQDTNFHDLQIAYESCKPVQIKRSFYVVERSEKAWMKQVSSTVEFCRKLNALEVPVAQYGNKGLLSFGSDDDVIESSELPAVREMCTFAQAFL